MEDDEFNTRTSRFHDWFKTRAQGTMIDSIQIADLRGRRSGRGMIATEDIPADTVLFEIPRASILCEKTSDLPQKLSHLWDRDGSYHNDIDGVPLLDSWSGLILIMIYELCKRDQSKWGPYFDIFPTHFDSLMFWADYELDELQASPVRQKIGQAEAEIMFRSKILPIIQGNMTMFETLTKEDVTDETLIKLCHRAGSIIMSYGFDLEEETSENEVDEEDWVEDMEGKIMMGLVPLADILNFDAECNVHINHGDDSLTATTLRPIRAGEEIFNYYGPYANSELLRRYGYVTAKCARFDEVEIPWQIIRLSIAENLHLPPGLFDQRFDMIEEEMGEEIEEVFVLHRDCEVPNDDGTWPDTSKVTMPTDLKETLKSFLNVVMTTDPARVPTKRARDGKITDIILGAVSKLEREYATTLVHDESWLAVPGFDVNFRLWLAVMVRCGEKKLLQEFREFLLEQATHQSSTSSGSNKRGLSDSESSSKRLRSSGETEGW